MSLSFHDWLDKLDMDPQDSGFVFVDNLEHIEDPYERIALETARNYKATAIYFRRFPDANRPSLPQIYIYDDIESSKSDTDIANLHKNLWNSGQVPLFFIFGKTQLKIFNCLTPPQLKANQPVITPLEMIGLATKSQKILDQFSAKLFDNGSFWETSQYKNSFKRNETAYETLLANLKKIRRQFIQEKILPKEIAHKLLVLSILVKYLEEREDTQGQRVFPDTFFEKYGGAKDFVSVLRKKGNCCQLFQALKEQFRGNIFDWTDEETAILADTELSRLADFLSGRVDLGDQYYLWPLYSFNHLPVELISNIYEEFLKEANGGKAEPGVVYTPPYLVHLLIDECMPLDKQHAVLNYKVLDPACGSGVFLVAAYRRIVQWWKLAHEWNAPDLTTLKQLLSNNIYGVDVKKEAVQLTIFSLSLALCDMLDPKVIWKELKFDDLDLFFKNNLKSADFFALLRARDFGKEGFDLVIGNPPFDEKLGEHGEKVETDRQQKVRLSLPEYTEFLSQFPHTEGIVKQHITIRDDNVCLSIDSFSKEDKKALGTEVLQSLRDHLPPTIPERQIALLFLEQAMTVCRSDGLLCLILPAGPFLYNNYATEFRTYFLKKYPVLQIFDFTALAEVLFGSSSVAAVAMFAKKTGDLPKKLLHVTVRRTKTAKEKFYFELDHYDFHQISYREALENSFIWKANFLGGGRIRYLLFKLTHGRKFGDYLKHKEDAGNWIISEGFSVGENVQEIERLKSLKLKGERLSSAEKLELTKLERKYKQAHYLTGKKTLPTRAFTEKGIDLNKICILREEYFHRRRQKVVFTRPLLLIKEVIGKHSIPVVFYNEDISFRNQIIGIHAPENHIDELREIEARIRGNKTYLFYIAGVSGRYMINKATSLLKSDIDNLPYPEDKTALELAEIEEILVADVLDYLLEFRRRGENSAVVKKAPGKKQLQQFGKLYCEILNSVYHKFQPAEPIETESFLCFPFYFGEKPDIVLGQAEQLESYLNQLLIRQQKGTNLRIIRVLRIYENNAIFLIKPKQLRYWLRSIAIRDADETFVDLRDQGY